MSFPVPSLFPYIAYHTPLHQVRLVKCSLCTLSHKHKITHKHRKNKVQNIHSHIQIDGHTHFEWEWGHLPGLNQSRTENTTPIPDYNSCTQPTKFYVHHLLSSQSSWSMSLSRNLPLSRPANNTYQNTMRKCFIITNLMTCRHA